MRRLAIAAVAAAIVLAACTEKTPETPTEPSTPSLAKAAVGPCESPFPLTDLLGKTGDMFGGASVGNAANSKIQSIGSQCGNGKVGNAQHEALNFVDWMLKKYRQNQLPDGTALRLTDLISTLFVAVGFQNGEIDPGVFGPDGAAGIYTGDELLLQNENKSLSLLIRADACLPTSFISMIRLPDSPQLVHTGGRRQFPPFYDINAANADGDHTTCEDLLVGFCADDAVYAQTDNPQIGHNPTEQAQQELEVGEFEVLRAANSDEYAELQLEFCPEQANEGEGPIIEEGGGLSLSGGFGGLAKSAWNQASRYVRPLADVLLPQPLHATMLGGLGLGGGGRSISPFGVVDDVVLESSSDPGNAETNFFVNEPISWYCGGYCFPEVRVRDFFFSGVNDADVSVTLIRLEGEGEESTVEFGEGSDLTETTNGSGEAEFDNLIITEEGTYLLEFTVPGNELPLRSGSFFVSEGG